MWEIKTISSLGRVVTGKTPPKENVEYWDGAELFVSPKDMGRDSTYINKTEALTTTEAFKKYKNQVLPPNSVLYTCLSFGFGKIGIAPKKLLTNQQINSIVVNDQNDYRFVYYLLRVSTPFIFSYNSGIDTPIVPKSVFEKIKLSVPDLSKQKKIANILFAYDDLIENNNRRIELLEKAAQELYKEWFVRFRFPNHENIKFVNGLPEGWEVKKLGEVYKFKKGTNITKENAVMGEVPVIAGGIEPSCYHNIANTTGPVITISASGANAGYIKMNYDNVWASDCSYIDNSQNHIYFAYELLNSMRIIVNNLQVGSAQPHVYPKDLNKLSIIYPAKKVIEIANNKFENFHKEISVLKRKNQNLKKQRDLLLPRLMSGRLEA